MLSEILSACKDLIDDAEISCADLVYKDICLDILAKARLVLNVEQFEELMIFMNEKLKGNTISSSGRKIRIQ